MLAPLIIVSGPPGAGKTTISRLVAASFDRSICLESDWFWTTIVQGFVPPWRAEASEQNRVVVSAYGTASATLAAGGFPVVLDALLGPWYLDLVTNECLERGVSLHYVVLRPRREVALARAVARVDEERAPGHPALTEEGPILALWDAFADLGEYEANVIDNSDLSPKASAGLILDRCRS